MEFRLLEYFLAVAREQNITAAAESLHISQPALSTQLKALETELGKQLLIRGVKGSRKVILTEEDKKHMEHQRGMKAITIPAHNYPNCRDVQVKCIKFVLPEDLNVSGGSGQSLCSERNLRVRVIANYIDTDFRCCDSTVVF